MTDLPDAIVNDATLGSWCPKLCTFACPVHEATGRADAVPWQFHRQVTALATGERTPQEVAPSLVACTGCLGCRTACEHDLDVPDQVRAARAVAPPRTPAATTVLEHLGAGRRPDGTGSAVAAYGQALPGDGSTILHVGCSDSPATVHAAQRLLEAAGHDVVVIDDGCCGQLATDLGAPDIATNRHDRRRDQLAGVARVVTLDPHCSPALDAAAPDIPILDLWTLLDTTPPPFRASSARTVTYHDPCLLARGAGVVDPPRRLLAAAGVTVAEPEHHGTHTACAGAGMGLDLLDPAAADATSQRRATHLLDAASTTVTACSRAGQRLGAAGVTVEDLACLLADCLEEPA
jgi:fumarate reductase (CoM/CoB) subunit B